MDPITLALMGGSLGSSIYGMYEQHEANQAAQAATQKALEQYISLHVPDPEQQKLELQHYQVTGQISPKLEAQIKADPTAFDQIVKNQKYSQAQDRALGQLQSLGEEGGLNLSDKADLQQQLLTNANKDKANRGAITDEMARRGQLGSGMDLQAELAGEQSSGDRDAQARLATLGSARDRALQAISGAGDLAGKLSSQDYQQKSDQATARDRINQFNTTNSQNVQQRNVEAMNNAQAANLALKQHVSDQNTDLSNKEQMYNKSLAQQQYENQLQKANGVAGAYGASATGLRQNGAQTAQSFGAIGSGLGQAAGTVQNQNNWNDWLAATTRKKNPAIGGTPLAGNDDWSTFSGAA